MEEKESWMVVDSGPIIAGSRIDMLATHLFTVQEVLDEIKDKKAREMLESPLFNITIRTPSPVAMNKVVAFCKKTGDFRSLSGTDLKVLALTLTIEMEKNDEKFVRFEPKPIVFNNMTLGQSLKKENVFEKKVENIISNNNEENETKEINENEENKNEENKEEEKNVIVEQKNENNDNNQVNKEENNKNEEEEEEEEDEDGEWVTAENDGEGDDSESDSDHEDEWITPENFGTKILNGSKEELDDGRIPVFCTTTDFAMQNIILQMGMQLKSIGGLRIRNVKNWVLRCFSCLKFCPDREKIFCPSCGNDTLQKLSVVIKEDGEVLYFPPRRKISNRGTQFSIPKPKSGSSNQKERWFYAEDQLLKFQPKKKKNKNSDNVFDANYSFGEKRKVNSQKTIIGSKPRKNPNEGKYKRKRK